MNNDFEEEKIEQMLLKYRPAKVPDHLGRQIFEVKQPRRVRFVKVISAAAAVFVICVMGLWFVKYSREQAEYNLQEQIMQVNAEIFAAGESAQLLALADILNEDSVACDQAGKIYEDILRNYPDSKPAKTIQKHFKNN